MLNVETETIVRKTIVDCRTLSIPECHYLMGIGWHEFFNDKSKNNTDDYKLDELTTMNNLFFHFYNGWTMRCNPNDKSITITIKDVGLVDILPTLDGDGIEVCYWGEDESLIYTCTFTIEELIEIEIAEV